MEFYGIKKVVADILWVFSRAVFQQYFQGTLNQARLTAFLEIFWPTDGFLKVYYYFSNFQRFGPRALECLISTH